MSLFLGTLLESRNRNVDLEQKRRTVLSNLLKGNIELILLAILEPAATYGGEITREVNERTNGYFDFKEGTLYPALHRLEKAGFIRGSFQYLPKGGSPVKFYELTPSGKTELHQRRDQYERFHHAMHSVLEKP